MTELTYRQATQDDAGAIESEVPAVVVAAPGVAERAQVVHGNLNWSTIVMGVTPAFLVAREWEVALGRPITHEDVGVAGKVALIGETVAERLFGGAYPVGQPVRVANTPFTVVGVLAHKGPNTRGNDQDDVLMIPLSTAKIRVFGSAHAISYSHSEEDIDMTLAAYYEALLAVKKALDTDDVESLLEGPPVKPVFRPQI